MNLAAYRGPLSSVLTEVAESCPVSELDSKGAIREVERAVFAEDHAARDTRIGAR